jgi:hypothetical protein
MHQVPARRNASVDMKKFQSCLVTAQVAYLLVNVQGLIVTDVSPGWQVLFGAAET